MNIQEFLGIKPNNIQRRVFVAAFVFGVTFVIDLILFVSIGLIEKGLNALSVFTGAPPFSFERIIFFVLILSVGVFVSLVYYVVLPMGPPPPIRKVPHFEI
jgi:uncharacterized membrane protein YedE/YeeE